MKKLFIAVLCCMFVFGAKAQEKGDIEVGGLISFDKQKSKGEGKDHSGFYFLPWVEYFITDNWSVGFSLMYQSDKDTNYKDNWFGFGPSLSRRIPITDRFSNTPHIYCDFWSGNVNDSISAKEKIFRLDAGLGIISFKYNLTNHWSIYFDSGRISYSFDKSKNSGIISSSFAAELITDTSVSISYTF